VKVNDASAEHKTAERLILLLEEVIKTVQDEWAALVVAIVTDASEHQEIGHEMIINYNPRKQWPSDYN
jgi:hypothetical protein